MLSDAIVRNTGTPQGCVLSPQLYSIFTYDCVTTSPDSTLIIKFADDTTLSGLISDNDESSYRNEVNRLVEWCSQNNLVLNVAKTKEMIIDFRRSAPLLNFLFFINGEEVEQVDCFKFLGIHISNNLDWSVQLNENLKKGQQRLFFSRQLKLFNVRKFIMVIFYRSVIESQLTSFILIWFNVATKKDLKKLNSVIKTCAYIIGTDLEFSETVYCKRILKGFSLF